MSGDVSAGWRDEYEAAHVPQPEDAGRCPDCGGRLRLEAGCKTCIVCGWSACHAGRAGR